ncbi:MULTISPECIES: DUF6932 family protein [Pseudomonas]|jgi:hypothetical protein|uniref:DUF6932 family protein n=1 Tax=Pseudomonas sp. WS 5412 TaxID=2717487 RepID=UPI0014762425|nr:hypothetical protein [Pseudomonas sp. WS 5412]NMY32896.1 hypothetical protein [Pseudomonas sp. WS 5412]
MPIPALDARGLLPGGIHVGTLRDIEQRFLFNQHRSDLYYQVKTFFDGELRGKAFGLQLVLGGSFFSDKEHPADIEATVYLPSPMVIAHVQLMALNNSAENARIKNSFRADFYVSLMVAGCMNLGQFFQYVGPKTAHDKGLHEKDARGVIEVEAWELG